MLTLKNLICAGTLLFFAIAPLKAQGWNGKDRPVHSIELMDGFASCVYSVKGSSTTGCGTASGNSFAFRYNCTFPNHWGVFAMIGSDMVFSYDKGFFGAMNKADGSKYLYRFNDNDCGCELDPILTVGVSYQWETGGFRFVPGVGLGYCDRYTRNFLYERRSRDGSTGPEYFTVDKLSDGKNIDYLIGGGYSYDNPVAFAVSADIKISYMLGRRFYAFVQPGVNWALGGFQVERTCVGSTHKYDPANWVEAVSYADAKDQWVRDNSSATTEIFNAHIPPIFHLNFGIGFEFGRKNR